MRKECLGARFRATSGVRERLYRIEVEKREIGIKRGRDNMEFGEGVLSGEEAKENRRARTSTNVDECG